MGSSHGQDKTYHGLCYTSCGSLAETSNPSTNNYSCLPYCVNRVEETKSADINPNNSVHSSTLPSIILYIHLLFYTSISNVCFECSSHPSSTRICILLVYLPPIYLFIHPSINYTIPPSIRPALSSLNSPSTHLSISLPSIHSSSIHKSTEYLSINLSTLPCICFRSFVFCLVFLVLFFHLIHLPFIHLYIHPSSY